MLKLIRNLIRNDTDVAEPDVHPSGLPSQALAAAALLFETARADNEIDDGELHMLRQRLAERFELSRDELDQLTDVALGEVERATGFYEFTSVLNEHFDYDARVEMVRAMWDVALADKEIDSFEEHTVRRVADLLHVAHRDFIRAKLDSRDQSR